MIGIGSPVKTHLQRLALATLYSIVLSSPSFPFPLPPPPLAGPGLGLVGPPPPLLFPPLQRPRPRRILIIRPPPGAHFPFSDHPMRLGFRPLPHRPFVQRSGPFRSSAPRRRLSRDDDIVRHMASKYGYRRPGFYPGGPSQRRGYRSFRDRGSGPVRYFRRPYIPARQSDRYYDSFDRYPDFDFRTRGDTSMMSGGEFGFDRTYRDGYTGTRRRLDSGRRNLRRRPSGFGQTMRDPRGGYLSEFGKRSPFRSSERLQSSNRPRIYTRPSRLRSSVPSRIIQDITGPYRDNVKYGVSSSFDGNILDLSKVRSIPVDRSPVSSDVIFDGAVDLTETKPPVNKPQPVSVPSKKEKAIRKPVKKRQGKKKPKISKQRTKKSRQRSKAAKLAVKKTVPIKGAKTVAKQIPRQSPLSTIPEATPLKIPVKVVPKQTIKPPVKPAVMPPHKVTKPEVFLPPPPKPKVIPKLDAPVAPAKLDTASSVVIDTVTDTGTGIGTQPALTLDTIVDLHATRPKIDTAVPANLLATSQSLNVDPLAPGVSILELGPGGSTNAVLSGSDLTGLGNVDVLTLSTEGFAALEKAIQSGKTISADVLDSIIGKGGATGKTGISKGEPAPEIVVIDHPTAGHESGHGTIPSGPSHKVVDNNLNLPPIAQATKVLSAAHSGHKTVPLDMQSYPESARHAILDLSVPMHDGQPKPHNVDGVGVVGDSVGSVEAKGSNDLLGIFAVPSGSQFPKVPKSVSSIPSSIGKLLTGGTNDHTAHTSH